ncbi:MAG: response regulator [Treponema sp.]|nr:response regulator [Treponema sp.]
MILSKYQEPITQERVILVIDDSVEYLLVCKHILEHYYDLAIAKSGEDALHILEERPVDLILLDVEMPGMSGIELFNILKASPLYCTIPVIFVSSHHDSEIINQAGKLGAKGYIIKPFTEENIFSRIIPVFNYSPGQMASVDLTIKLAGIESSLLREFKKEKKEDSEDEDKYKYISFEEKHQDAFDIFARLREKNKYNARIKMEIERIYMLVKNKDTHQALARINRFVDDLGVKKLADAAMPQEAKNEEEAPGRERRAEEGAALREGEEASVPAGEPVVEPAAEAKVEPVAEPVKTKTKARAKAKAKAKVKAKAKTEPAAISLKTYLNIKPLVKPGGAGSGGDA